MAAIIDTRNKIYIGESYDTLIRASSINNVRKVSIYNRKSDKKIKFLVNDNEGNLFFLILKDGHFNVKNITDDAEFVDIVLNFNNFCGLEDDGNVRWWDIARGFSAKRLYYERKLNIPEEILSIINTDGHIHAVSITGNIYKLPDLELVHNAEKTGIKAKKIRIHIGDELILDVNGNLFFKGDGSIIGKEGFLGQYKQVEGFENIVEVFFRSDREQQCIIALDNSGKIFFTGVSRHDQLFGIDYYDMVDEYSYYYPVANLVDDFGTILTLSDFPDKEASVVLNNDNELWYSNGGLFERTGSDYIKISSLANEVTVREISRPTKKSARKT